MRLFRKKLSILDFIFILVGGRFYMDWILPTNPASKNPLWKFIMYPFRSGYSNKVPKNRFYQSFAFIGVHLIFSMVYLFNSDFFAITNILVNIYPIIVNTYIAIRLYQVIQKRKEHKEDVEHIRRMRDIKLRSLTRQKQNLKRILKNEFST